VRRPGYEANAEFGVTVFMVAQPSLLAASPAAMVSSFTGYESLEKTEPRFPWADSLVSSPKTYIICRVKNMKFEMVGHFSNSS